MNVTKRIRIAIKAGLVITLLSGSVLSGAAHATAEGSLFCLYSKQNFKGQEHCGSARQVNWLGWRADTSSLKVKEGYELVAFDYGWQFGRSTVFEGEQAKLEQWNNRIASFQLGQNKPSKRKCAFIAASAIAVNGFVPTITFAGWAGAGITGYRQSAYLPIRKLRFITTGDFMAARLP